MKNFEYIPRFFVCLMCHIHTKIILEPYLPLIGGLPSAVWRDPGRVLFQRPLTIQDVHVLQMEQSLKWVRVGRTFVLARWRHVVPVRKKNIKI